MEKTHNTHKTHKTHIGGKISFTDVIKKTKKSETTLIDAYEDMNVKEKNYQKAYDNHLENIHQVDDFANFNGMETIFKKVIMKNIFNTGKVDKNNPLLFRNYLTFGESLPSTFRREHILKQINYIFKKYFSGRDDMFIKNKLIDDIGKHSFNLTLNTIENIKYNKEITHDNYLVNKHVLKKFFTDVLTTTKKHLKRGSLIMKRSNNNDNSNDSNDSNDSKYRNKKKRDTKKNNHRDKKRNRDKEDNREKKQNKQNKTNHKTPKERNSKERNSKYSFSNISRNTKQDKKTLKQSSLIHIPLSLKKNKSLVKVNSLKTIKGMPSYMLTEYQKAKKQAIIDEQKKLVEQSKRNEQKKIDNLKKPDEQKKQEDPIMAQCNKKNKTSKTECEEDKNCHFTKSGYCIKDEPRRNDKPKWQRKNNAFNRQKNTNDPL